MTNTGCLTDVLNFSPWKGDGSTGSECAGDSEEKLRTRRYFPLAVSQDHGLTIAMLWAAVERYMPNGETRAVPCDATIAEDLGVSERTVRRRRKKAMDAGVLTYAASESGRRAYELLYGGDRYVGGNRLYKKYGQYLTIPDALWESDLSDAAKALLAYCDRLTTRCCWKTISEKLGISQPTMRAARTEARESGLLMWENKAGQPPEFEVPVALTAPDSFFIPPDDISRGPADIFMPTHQYPISTPVSIKREGMSCADRRRRLSAITHSPRLFVSEVSDGDGNTEAPPGAQENDKHRSGDLQPLREMVEALRREDEVRDLAGFQFARFRHKPVPADVCEAVRRRVLNAYTVEDGGLRKANGDAVANVCGLLCDLLKDAYSKCVEGELSAEGWRAIEEDKMRAGNNGEGLRDEPPYKKIRKAWNDFARAWDLARIEYIEGTLKENVRRTWQTLPGPGWEGQTPFDYYQAILHHASGSELLMGSVDDEDWMMNFHWLFEDETNFLTISEGTYTDEPLPDYGDDRLGE